MATGQQILKQLNAQQNLITQLQQQLAMLQSQNQPQGQPGPPGPQGPPGEDADLSVVNIPSQIDVAEPKIFSGDGRELNSFITACKIYLNLKMTGRLQMDQVTWVLSYVQRGAAESWKENIMEMIEDEEEEAPASTEELFDSLQNNFGDADEESTAVGKLRLIKQGSKSAEEHVQEFKKIAQDSAYEGRALIEEYKRSLSGRIRKALMEAENPPTTIKSWYEWSMKLDRQWRQAKVEEDYYWRGQAKPQPRIHTQNNTFVRPQPQRRDPNAMDVDTTAGPSRGPIKCYKCGKLGHMAKYCWSKAPARDVRTLDVDEQRDYWKRMFEEEQKNLKEELARNRRVNGGAEGLAQQPKEKAEGWAQSPGDVADRLNGDKAERLEEDNSKTATAGKVEAGQVHPKRISAQKKNRSREEREQLETWVRGMTEEMPEEEEIRSIDSVEQAVPRRFHKFLKVFKQKESERMPTRKPWDHAIELKEDFKPKKGKIYPLSPNKREEVQAFVKDQLRKGYIRPLKSSQTSPVFFVPKKDGKKRMVQDYRFLNDWTIKNNYPLPLISELIDTMGSKRLFSKIDLRWGYNNIRIKEGDEWKAAFC
ncbi:transcriptional regulator family: Zinc finger, CCHC-type [Agaricus bisporus var. burnettii]|uniref:Transcriptional regulator family: Zinc finger, CCHC-type n=1 Tax=Agaricus bisporus var. burnettii TaxID=192524 RepID=A0A8H7EWE2_AGABI|nr:transcriptional regulator family: Zinc finger, CCHC-type [Agaricus bisporus var. burnettii]